MSFLQSMGPAPYPADTLAKGWKFQLDIERVRRSDTWALAAAEARPWLLMLWAEAWTQAPCGSLPADDEVIAARIGMPLKAFTKHRAALLRGWRIADDGRLYHATITELVREMVSMKDAERARKAAWRAKKEAERDKAGHQPTDDLSRGTDTGQTPDGHGKDDTGTGTGTGIGKEGEYSPTPQAGAREPEVSGFAPTQAGAVCKALRQAGIADTNPGHPRLLALLDAGATEAEFLGFAKAAIEGGKGFAWVLGAVEGERKRAAVTAQQLHRGAMPNKQQAIEARNRAVADEWLAQQGAA